MLPTNSKSTVGVKVDVQVIWSLLVIVGKVPLLVLNKISVSLLKLETDSENTKDITAVSPACNDVSDTVNLVTVGYLVSISKLLVVADIPVLPKISV